MSILAITSGEPAGIGPDLCLQLPFDNQPVVIIADKSLLQLRANELGIDVLFHNYTPTLPYIKGKLSVLHIPLVHPTQTGILDSANSFYVLQILRRAIEGCMLGEFSGMVTAPIHKGIINQAGFHFSGHTEFLAEQSNTSQVVMMLIGGHMRVALTTTHLPLRNVADAITAPLLENVLRVLHHDLQFRFGVSNPRILVAGLNPHAGEDGHLGREEIDVMIPVINKLQTEGFNISLPQPADTLFVFKRLHECDVVLTMYHDQGLPVLKHASFGTGVNITLGLPFIRTSVDHGTALDLAGSGIANVGSLQEAIKIALEMVKTSTSNY